MTTTEPDQALREAMADVVAGRHQAALARLLWFHQNAIRLQPSLSGVRRSYALHAWKNLADRYPPAMKALRKSRDIARDDVRTHKGRAAGDHYADFAAINHYLDEEPRTIEFFKWLHKHRPKIARDVYHRTEEVLARANEFKLCGAYIDGEEQFTRIRHHFRVSMRLARKPGIGGAGYQRYARKSFSEKTTRLVALLALNGRTVEAKQVVVRAKRVWFDARFTRQLALAQQGRF